MRIRRVFSCDRDFHDVKGISTSSFRVGVSSIGRPLSIVYGNDEKGEFNGVGGVTGR